MAGYSVARHNGGFTTGRGHERQAIRLCWNHCVEPRSGRCADECDHRKTGGSRRRKQTSGKDTIMTGKNSKNDASSPSLSRRAFLARLTVSTAVASTAMGAPTVLAKKETESGDHDDKRAEAQLSEMVGGEPRREQAFQLRLRAAIAERKVPI